MAGSLVNLRTIAALVVLTLAALMTNAAAAILQQQIASDLNEWPDADLDPETSWFASSAGADSVLKLKSEEEIENCELAAGIPADGGRQRGGGGGRLQPSTTAVVKDDEASAPSPAESGASRLAVGGRMAMTWMGMAFGAAIFCGVGVIAA